MDNEYDYIVVGAGSAGCALAGRLADTGNDSIALLEAGPHDHSGVVTVPLGLGLVAGRSNARNYGYRSQPQPALDGRRGKLPRGRGLGGSSSINGMVYIRGTPSDYDRWAAAGCSGWSWRDLLPYFKRSECNERLGGAAEDALHGGRGPLHVADIRTLNPFARHFVEAAHAAGHRYNHDFNGEVQEGVGYYQFTQRRGERWNAARAYLHQGYTTDAALNGGRSHLHVLPDTQVLHVVFEGRRAVGVAVLRGGIEQVLRVRREVIVSGGAFASPQLLMASGIGPAEHLREMSVPVVHDLPQVGENLQDHPDTILFRRLFSTDFVGLSVRGALRMWKEWGRYQRERTGMMTASLTQAGGFLRSEAGLADPDLQLHFVSAMPNDGLKYAHGYSCHVCVLRPHSRGRVRLAAPDTHVNALVEMNLLADERDMALMVKGLALVRRILDQEPLARFGAKPVFDGHLRFDGSDDDAVRAMVREQADTVYHPVGTCRMGSDADSVVDPQLRVRGVEGLRVADASVMPTLIGGNTNATAIVIGEKAADLLRGRVSA